MPLSTASTERSRSNHRRHGQPGTSFANRWAPLVVGRNIGLMTMELFTPARDVLAQRTLGWVAR
ncbi:hypothetical protein SE957_00445 [Escherichia coli]|nr:hypothetical protein [Escherichia coli]